MRLRMLALLSLPLMSQAANYTAERKTVDGIEVIHLADSKQQAEVWIAPTLGFNSYEMRVKGKRVFFSPYQTLGEFKAKPTQLGNPFLSPWANRLDHEGFFANGKAYRLNPELKNYRLDAFRQPIHGLVVFAEWQVTSVKADSKAAQVTAKLEFWRHPDWMEQFPFAHTTEMTYRLRDGVLEVETIIENLSTDPMPVSIGFHPYFQVNDAPRDQWTVHLAAKEHVELNDKLTPTGETKPVDSPKPVSLAGRQLDDVYTSLERDSNGIAEFWVLGKQERVKVRYGANFKVAVVYAPPGRDFICFEPMSGVTNAFNLAHKGKYKELQTIAAGGKWKESFWIATEGF
jgi:aldose 1-epimerase